MYGIGLKLSVMLLTLQVLLSHSLLSTALQDMQLVNGQMIKYRESTTEADGDAREGVVMGGEEVNSDTLYDLLAADAESQHGSSRS